MIDTAKQSQEPAAEHARAELVAPSELSPGRRAFDTLVRSREASILAVLVLVIAAATIAVVTTSEEATSRLKRLPVRLSAAASACL